MTQNAIKMSIDKYNSGKTNRIDLYDVGKFVWKFEQDMCYALYELCNDYLQEQSDDNDSRAQPPQQQLMMLLLTEAVEAIYSKFESARFRKNGIRVRLTVSQQAAILYLLQFYGGYVVGSCKLLDELNMQFTKVIRSPLGIFNNIHQLKN